MTRSSRRPLPRVLVGAAALALQLLTPALHQLHGAPPLAAHGAATAHRAPAHDAVAHDAQACVFCAAAAQGRAVALTEAAAPVVLAATLEPVLSAAPRLASALSRPHATPRAPPPLA